MGMFDRVFFEDVEKHFNLIDWGDHKLDSDVIDAIKEENDFQTKCLDNYLGNYIITAQGYLKSQHFEEYEHINDEDSPLKFRVKQKGEYWMDENFHGIVTIYNGYPIINDDNQIYINFNLKFTDGQLVNIKCSEIEKF